MATWLNALLSGACSFTVYRDSVAVTDLAAVGATLTTTGGAVLLTTPTDESHTWEVVASADFLLSPSALRMVDASFTGLPGLDTAEARVMNNGATAETIALSTADPILPNPATFAAYGNAVSLYLAES